jgi:ABC-2 type transport system permease protein
MWAASAVVSRPRARTSAQLWWQLARRSFHRSSTYRGATFAGAFTNTVFGFLRVYILLAVLEVRPGTGGFDAIDAVTFTFLTQGLLAVSFALGGDTDIATRIRTGDVVSDLYRPVDFQGYWLATDLGRAAFTMLFRGIPPLAFAALFFELRLPSSAMTWIAFVASVWLGAVVAFAIRFASSLSGFWLLDARGVGQITSLVTLFFSGVTIPLTFLPDTAARVVAWLPFAGLAQLPAEVFLGKHDGALHLLSVLGRQAVWAVVLLALGRAITRRAFHKVVVQGG